MTEISTVKSDLALLRLEASALKREFALISGNVPPISGARHIEIRKFSVFNQIEQIQDDFVLLLGDSITESLYINRFCNLPVVNAGMAGGGIQAALDFFSDFPRTPRLKGVIIAIGVNDAVRRTLPPEFLDHWEVLFRDLVAKAEKFTPNVAVNTIIPVEGNKPLGEPFFDTATILRLTSIIRKVADERGLILIDNDRTFAAMHAAMDEYSIDGVHLNQRGFEAWKTNLTRSEQRFKVSAN